MVDGRKKQPAPRPKRGKERAPAPIDPAESDVDTSRADDVSPAKSPGILSSLKKTFTRKSQDEGSTSPYSTRKNTGVSSRPVVEVVPPPRRRPAADYSSYREPIESDYQDVGSPVAPFASTSSLRSYATVETTSDHSNQAALGFELDYMRKKWRESQEDLQRERARAAAQEEMYRRELEAREARYQRELEYAKAGRSGGDDPSARGKRRM